MRANLYLHKDSFQYNGTDTLEQVKKKMCSFVDDLRDVVYGSRDENFFCISAGIWEVSVFEKLTLGDAISRFLDGDRQGVIYTMLANTASQYDYSLEELNQKTKYNPDETEVNSVVVLNSPSCEVDKNQYIQFDDYEIVYDRSSWVTLRRQILGNHPGSPEEFIRDCRRYFSDICFHDNCVASLVDNNYNYLEFVPRKFVYYLSCLNDCFDEVRRSHRDAAPHANDILTDFSGQFGLDKAGSIQANADVKRYLTFDFQKETPNGSQMVPVLCEPHLKIEAPDKNRCDIRFDPDVFHPRIYFNFGIALVEKGKILVGSIGRHVSCQNR